MSLRRFRWKLPQRRRERPAKATAHSQEWLCHDAPNRRVALPDVYEMDVTEFLAEVAVGAANPDAAPGWAWESATNPSRRQGPRRVARSRSFAVCANSRPFVYC